MNRLTVVFILTPEDRHTAETLKSLVGQSVDSFNVLIIDTGAPEEAEKLCRGHVEEYIGFEYREAPGSKIYECMNSAAQECTTEYISFLLDGEELSPDSVEKLYEHFEKLELKPDIVTGRQWLHGDIEYTYDPWLDVLAVMPVINKYETALIKSDAIGARVFRRSVFQARRLSFDENLSAYGGTLLILDAAFDGARVSGCPGFVHEKLVVPISDGFPEEYVPTIDKLNSLRSVTDRILAMGRAALIEETGSAEYDIAFMQEVIANLFDRVFADFYRRMWFADNELLAEVKAILDEYAPRMNPQRFKKLAEKNADLALPMVFTEREDAAEHPRLTVMMSFDKIPDPGAMLRSVFAQTCPLFELAVPQSTYDNMADFYKSQPNIRPFPDKSFHYDARKASKSGRIVDVRSGKYLDFDLFKETVNSKTPSVLLQYKFSQRRTTMRTRREMKDKGFVLPEQLGSDGSK